VSTIQLVLAPEIKYNVSKETTLKVLWEKLKNIYALVPNQSPLFEDEVVSTQNGDGRRSP